MKIFHGEDEGPRPDSIFSFIKLFFISPEATNTEIFCIDEGLYLYLQKGHLASFWGPISHRICFMTCISFFIFRLWAGGSVSKKMNLSQSSIGTRECSKDYPATHPTKTLNETQNYIIAILGYLNTVLDYFIKVPWKFYKTSLNPIKHSFYPISRPLQDYLETTSNKKKQLQDKIKDNFKTT